MQGEWLRNRVSEALPGRRGPADRQSPPLRAALGNAESLPSRRARYGKECQKAGKQEQIIDANAPLRSSPRKSFQGALVQMRKAEKLL